MRLCRVYYFDLVRSLIQPFRMKFIKTHQIFGMYIYHRRDIHYIFHAVYIVPFFFFIYYAFFHDKNHGINLFLDPQKLYSRSEKQYSAHCNLTCVLHLF